LLFFYWLSLYYLGSIYTVTEKNLIVDFLFFLFFSYPPNGLSAIKILMWLFAILFGVIIGKIGIHYWLLCCKLKVKLFTKEGKGSWVVISLVTCCVLFYQSTLYNALLTVTGGGAYDEYQCTSNLHIEYKSFMKGAAVVTWLSDFFIVWMVLDTILQVRYTPPN